MKKRDSKEIHLKVNESQYKQCGVTAQFPTGQNLLEKMLKKDKY